jgi:hypothetical protein
MSGTAAPAGGTPSGGAAHPGAALSATGWIPATARCWSRAAMAGGTARILWLNPLLRFDGYARWPKARPCCIVTAMPCWPCTTCSHCSNWLRICAKLLQLPHRD